MARRDRTTSISPSEMRSVVTGGASPSSSRGGRNAGKEWSELRNGMPKVGETGGGGFTSTQSCAVVINERN
jgi:hypothetical protein